MADLPVSLCFAFPLQKGKKFDSVTGQSLGRETIRLLEGSTGGDLLKALGFSANQTEIVGFLKMLV